VSVRKDPWDDVQAPGCITTYIWADVVSPTLTELHGGQLVYQHTRVALEPKSRSGLAAVAWNKSMDISSIHSASGPPQKRATPLWHGATAGESQLH
jgi:hypothetical protein